VIDDALARYHEIMERIEANKTFAANLAKEFDELDRRFDPSINEARTVAESLRAKADIVPRERIEEYGAAQLEARAAASRYRGLVEQKGAATEQIAQREPPYPIVEDKIPEPRTIEQLFRPYKLLRLFRRRQAITRWLDIGLPVLMMAYASTCAARSIIGWQLGLGR